jgi:hypothetical protein
MKLNPFSVESHSIADTQFNSLSLPGPDELFPVCFCSILGFKNIKEGVEDKSIQYIPGSFAISLKLSTCHQ